MTAESDADGRTSPEADGPEADVPGKEGAREFVPPRDGSWVPRGRLDDVIAKLKSLEEKVKVQNAPKRLSRADLDAEVEAGKLSREQADATWEGQITADAAQAAVKHVEQASQAKALGDTLLAYEEAVPELKDTSSATYARIAQEVAYLQGIGHPEGLATVVAATRSVMGPLNALKVRKAPGPKGGEGHQEGGSGGGEGSGRKPDRRTELSARETEHFRKLIDKGVYRDWDAVHAERAAADKLAGEAKTWHQPSPA